MLGKTIRIRGEVTGDEDLVHLVRRQERSTTGAISPHTNKPIVAAAPAK